PPHIPRRSSACSTTRRRRPPRPSSPRKPPRSSPRSTCGRSLSARTKPRSLSFPPQAVSKQQGSHGMKVVISRRGYLHVHFCCSRERIPSAVVAPYSPKTGLLVVFVEVKRQNLRKAGRESAVT